MDRKGMKANARKAYKRHYWMIVVICLFASVFGVAYSSSTWSVNASSPSATVQEDGTAQSDNVSKVLENLLVGDESQARRQVEHNQEQIVQNDTNAMMGRKRGVFASLLNSFSSGSVILSMADAANSIVHNDGVAVAVPIVVSLAVYLFVWLFVQQICEQIDGIVGMKPFQMILVFLRHLKYHLEDVSGFAIFPLHHPPPLRLSTRAK